MKKILVLCSTILFAFSLSACDLIPEDVVEISEEYCRENPEAEICQGESVGDLDDEVVLNVYNTIVNEYNDETIDTFCDDYISITNTELLDQCRTDRSVFIPDNFTDFTVTGVSKQSSLSTQDVYEIATISSDMTRIVTFTVGLVNVDGIMYINAWSFNEQTQNPQEIDVPDEDAEAYFRQFITDWLNESLDSNTVCNEYLPSTEIDGCISDRDQADLSEASIEITDFTLQQDGTYEATITIKETPSSTPEEQVLSLTFSYSEYGEITMTLTELDNGNNNELPTASFVTGEDARTIIEEFIADYLDANVTDDYLNQTYFDGMADSEFFVDREIDLANGTTLSIGTITEPTDYPADQFILVDVTRTENGTSTTMQIPMSVYITAEEQYLITMIFPDDVGDIDLSTVQTFLNQVFTDYMDDSITSETVCTMYFAPEAADLCIENRDMQLELGWTITLKDVFIEEDMFHITIEIDDGTEIITETQQIEVYYDEEDNLKLLVYDESQGDMITYEEAEIFINQFFLDYMDENVLDEDICPLFADELRQNDCFENRKNQLESNWTITLNNFFMKDGLFFVEFTMDDGTTSEIITQEVKIFYNESDELKIHFVEEQMNDIPTEEMNSHLQTFLDNVNNSDITNEDVCTQFVGPEAQDLCLEFTENLRLNNATINNYILHFDNDGNYYVEFKVAVGSETHSILFDVYFYYDIDSILYMTLSPKDMMQPITIDEAWTFFTDFEEQFNNTSLSTDEVCDSFLDIETSSGCIEKRTHAIENNLVLDIIDIWMIEDYFQVELEFKNELGEPVDNEIINVFFFYDESDTLKAKFGSDGNYVIDQDSAVAYVEKLMNDFVDETLTTTEFCALYFPWDTASECFLNRSDYDLSTLDWQFIRLDKQNNGEFYELEFKLINTTTLEEWNQFFPVSFFIDETETVRMMINQMAYWEILPASEAQTIIQQFITDYQDDTRSNDYMNEQYFDFHADDEFYANRDNDLLNNTTITILSMELPPSGNDYDYIKLTLEFDDGTNTFNQTIFIRIYTIDNSRYLLEINEEQPFMIDYEQANSLFDTYVTDFNDSSLTDDEVCFVYFDNEQSDICSEQRQSMVENNMVLSLNAFWQEGEEYFAEIVYLNENGSQIYNEIIHVKFYKTETDSIHMMFEQIPVNNAIDYEQAYNTVTTMVDEFNNNTISSSEFCSSYPNMFTDCISFRDAILSNGGSISIIDFIQPDDFTFSMELEIKPDATSSSYNITYKTSFYYDETNTLQFEVSSLSEGFNYATFADAQTIFTQFITDYLDSNYTHQQIADMYFNGYSDPLFAEQRDADLADGLALNDIVYTDPSGMDGMDYIKAVITLDNNGTSIEMTQYFRVLQFLTEGQMIDIKPQDPMEEPSVNYDTAYDYMFDLFTDFSDTQNLTDEQFCNMYFQYDSTRCQESRLQFANNYSSVKIKDFTFDESLYTYVLTLEFFDLTNELVETKTYYVDLWWADDMMLDFYIMEVDDPTWNQYQVIEQEMNLMLDTFMDSSVSTLTYCDMYYPNDPECQSIKDHQLQGDVYDAYVLDLWWDKVLFGEATYFARVEYIFNDNTNETHFLALHIAEDSNGELVITYETLGREISVPSAATQQGYTTSQSILQQFALDYSDSSISNQQLCDLYFGGVINPDICGDEREMILDQNATVTLSSLTEMTDQSGATYFTAVFEFTIGSSTETQEGDFRVYTLTNGNYFIEFVDQETYAPNMATFDDSDLAYRNFAQDYNNPTITDTELCSKYFGIASNDCALNRQTNLNDNKLFNLIDFTLTTIDDVSIYTATYSFVDQNGNTTEPITVYLESYYNSDHFVMFNIVENPF